VGLSAYEAWAVPTERANCRPGSVNRSDIPIPIDDPPPLITGDVRPIVGRTLVRHDVGPGIVNPVEDLPWPINVESPVGEHLIDARTGNPPVPMHHQKAPAPMVTGWNRPVAARSGQRMRGHR
jgi:hypothetical protein